MAHASQLPLIVNHCWSRVWLMLSVAIASVQTFTFTFTGDTHDDDDDDDDACCILLCNEARWYYKLILQLSDVIRGVGSTFSTVCQCTCLVCSTLLFALHRRHGSRYFDQTSYVVATWQLLHLRSFWRSEVKGQVYGVGMDGVPSSLSVIYLQ